jgi:hypothetical protein
MPDVLMKCGHRSQTEKDGNPICLICIGIHEGATIVDESVTDETLKGRKARCSYYGSKCHSEEPSSLSLAFFSHRPDKEYDSYYCGCYGWD